MTDGGYFPWKLRSFRGETGVVDDVEEEWIMPMVEEEEVVGKGGVNCYCSKDYTVVELWRYHSN